MTWLAHLQEIQRRWRLWQRLYPSDYVKHCFTVRPEEAKAVLKAIELLSNCPGAAAILNSMDREMMPWE